FGHTLGAASWLVRMGALGWLACVPLFLASRAVLGWAWGRPGRQGAPEPPRWIPMTHGDAFLQDIIEHPDDGSFRLIYAHWLDERRAPRGEFLRVQCELSRLPQGDPRRAELEAKERVLLAEYKREWARPVRRLLGGMVTGVEFRRGFVEAAR